jgi:peptide deformylase
MSNIITDIDQLKQPAEPLEFLTEDGVQPEECLEIISKIKDELLANNNIIALSAPQIGINKRIFCMRFNDQIKTFINPIITKKSGLSIVIETCESMPGKEIVIGRPEEVTIVYYNEDFKYEDNKLLGIAASLFDQQAQILDGILPCELGLVSDIIEDGNITEADLEEIIPFYRDTFLPGKLESLNAAISDDAEMAKQRNIAGEIMGAKMAVDFCMRQGIPEVEIYHDYEGVGKWADGLWKANNPMTQAYVRFIEKARTVMKITFVKVTAHSGNKYNEKADKLAKEALGI